jgi:hypothetical protein
VADTKTSALTELAGASVVADDWIPIVDSSATTTKKLNPLEIKDIPSLGLVPTATFPCCLVIACSDLSTAIVTGTGKASFRMPYAMTVTAVRASLNSAAATGTFTVDINEGAGAGTTILSTKLTIDATELTSTTAAAAAVISDTALADDARITIDVDDDASGDATGLVVSIIGTRVV